jgi:hypothetical protein
MPALWHSHALPAKPPGLGMMEIATNLNVNAAKCSSFPSAALRANI